VGATGIEEEEEEKIPKYFNCAIISKASVSYLYFAQHSSEETGICI
jgi:hypothetical protein